MHRLLAPLFLLFMSGLLHAQETVTSPFLGVWINKETVPHQYIRAILRLEKDRISLQLSARQGTEQSCPQGIVLTEVQAVDAEGPSLKATWENSIKVVVQTLRIQSDGRLQIKGLVHYIDQSGRKDVVIEEVFSRQEKH